MSKKYFFFIGSTLDDLKNERRELPRIIMELGHIPVMPEYLAPASKQLAEKIIGACDYFIALAAHKYVAGAAAGGNTSALEEEYALAVKLGVPVIALVIDEKARWKAAKKESDPELVQKMEDFKQKLRSCVCETWLSIPDLCQKAQNVLIRETSLNPQTGWVTADQTALPAVANELSRLSAENEQLRRQVKAENSGIAAQVRAQIRHAIKVLALNKVTLSFYYTSGGNWENTRQFRCLRIFKLLVPELALGKTTAEISRFLGTVLNPDLEKTVRKDYPTPSNTIKKIMADFSLLKLVKCANPAEDGGGDEVWEITGYGKELYSVYRMRQLEKAFDRKKEKK